MPFPPTDERPHPPGAGSWWQETWVFDLWTPDGLGAFTWLTLVPNQRRAWYWAVLVRPGEPVLYLADVDVPLPRSGLEVRSEGLWASHECEVAFEQWTVANEAYAVALDHPDDALGRAHGRPAPGRLRHRVVRGGGPGAAGGHDWLPPGRHGGRTRRAAAGAPGGRGARLPVALVGRAAPGSDGSDASGSSEVEGFQLALRLGDDPNGSVVVRALTPDGWREWRRTP